MKYPLATFSFALAALLSSCGGGGSDSTTSAGNDSSTIPSEAVAPSQFGAGDSLQSTGQPIGELQVLEFLFVNEDLIKVRTPDGWQETLEENFDVQKYTKIDDTHATLELWRTVQKPTEDLNLIGAIEISYELNLEFQQGAVIITGTETNKDFTLFRDPSIITTTEAVSERFEWQISTN